MDDGNLILLDNSLFYIRNGTALLSGTPFVALGSNSMITNDDNLFVIGGEISVPAGTVVTVTATGIVELSDTSTWDGDGLITNQADGSWLNNLPAGATAQVLVPFVNNGFFIFNSGTVNFGAVTQQAGVTILGGGTMGVASGNTFQITGGVLTGRGLIDGSIENAGGIILNGITSDQSSLQFTNLQISGEFAAGSASIFEVFIDASVGNADDVLDLPHSRLTINGKASVSQGATVKVCIFNTPDTGTEYLLISWLDFDNEFDVIFECPADFTGNNDIETAKRSIRSNLKKRYTPDYSAMDACPPTFEHSSGGLSVLFSPCDEGDAANEEVGSTGLTLVQLLTIISSASAIFASVVFAWYYTWKKDARRKAEAEKVQSRLSAMARQYSLNSSASGLSPNSPVSTSVSASVSAG